METYAVAINHLPLVEGILALHFVELFDLSIYLEASEHICFHRRKVRDIAQRHRSLEFITWQYKK
jgi:uridine kinase